MLQKSVMWSYIVCGPLEQAEENQGQIQRPRWGRSWANDEVTWG